MEITEKMDVVAKEKRRIIREMKKGKIPAHKMKLLDATVSNAALLKVKLEEMKERALTEEVEIEYDNGGGQKGIRDNPFLKRYESLFKTYMLAMDKVLAAFPNDSEATKKKLEPEKPETVLDMIKAKRKDGA